MSIIKSKLGLMILMLPLPLALQQVQAAEFQDYLNSAKKEVSQIFNPQQNDSNKVSVQALSNFQLEQRTEYGALPTVTSAQPKAVASVAALSSNQISNRSEVSMVDAIHQALQQHPDISQSIASMASQNANIDTAKSQYFPQISGGISTADLTTGERGRQLYTLSATQMLYDFGKVKTSVNTEEAKLLESQAQLLVDVDNIAYQTVNAIVNINRYQEIVKIAEQQVKGVGRIAEIANLRARAGISSQADPVQAQSTLEAAETNKIVQETALRQYQQKLSTLLGYNALGMKFTIPDYVVRNAGLYQDPEFTRIPDMMAAQANVEIAKSQKEQAKLNAYPTINIKGSLSQALNGRNPNNNEDDGLYSSVMLEANSNFFQGGAIRSRARSAGYAEEAAKAQVKAVYRDVSDQVRLIREQVVYKQKQMDVLSARRETTARTKELYQEQYKLGTRTVLDLLNAEQSIHSVAQEIENARYDIYSGLIEYIKVTGRSREFYQLNNLPIQGIEIEP
ncbi:TolC family protein [Acinetobacter sp. ANC 3813]|uniref:TolC family protein n=1 Tax=Acinetobacter sp. ANC 3813 TaxID=1977873 RepID=UPI000A34EB28|nr:TolC family protein [Acinetobacter sp. ANC 3813]OTG86050.1 RND transporter [Acinetobacter sp. ANC 3813]